MKKLVGFLAVLALLAGVVYVVIQVAASNVDLSTGKVGEDSVIYARDGKTVLGHIAGSGAGDVSLTDAQVSPLLRHAHMAIEDRGFYEHEAVSWPHMAWAVITSGGSAGGSTITQQYVKNAYLTREKSLDRKAKEIPYAYRVEQEFSKDQILTKYMNSIPYGRGAYGVEDAAKTWFGISATELKDMSDPLQVARACFLAALVQRPSFFAEYQGRPSQLKHWQEITDRTTATLNGLRKIEGVAQKDLVPQTVIDQAKKLLPLKITNTLKASGTSKDTDPYLLDYVKQWITAWQTQALKDDDKLNDADAATQGESAAEGLLARGGLSIHTSIDSNLQTLVAQSVASRRFKSGLSTGVVILDPQSGAVAAMYGGSDHAKDAYNYALYANRQVGSTMKTVVLADAVKNDISVQSVFAAPAYIQIDGSKIYNDDKKAAPGCKLTLADAMAQSNNPVHIELITGKMASCDNPAALSSIDSDYPVSPSSVVALAHKMGADDSLVPGKSTPAKLDAVPTLALGVSSLTPLKLASIGGTLANNGTHTKPHIIDKISTNTDSTVYENEEETNRVLSAKQAGIVNQVLTGVYTKGTARGAQVSGHPLAGKTGTTPTDAWMLAYSAVKEDQPAYVCSAWTGYADNRVTSASGGDLWGADVAKICQSFFAGALKDVPKIDFPKADLSSGKMMGLSQEKAPEPQTTEEKPKPTPTTKHKPTPTTKPPTSTTSSSSIPETTSEAPPTTSSTEAAG